MAKKTTETMKRMNEMMMMELEKSSANMSDLGMSILFQHGAYLRRNPRIGKVGFMDNVEVYRRTSLVLETSCHHNTDPTLQIFKPGC
jgi:hypothetical protein